MIFILHYLLFNAGLPAIIILITLFLQTHSDASLAEIGALLMALPFVSVLIKPLCCALADRQQAHRLYLMAALALMALGYGSLTVAPFFPAWTRLHGRLVWYGDIAGIVLGYSAFGVVWSLGDALAVNHAQMAGVPWGAYRVWGVVAWGAGGILIGQINELTWLPRYVPAMFVLLLALLAEICLLALWPNRHFVMGGASLASDPPEAAPSANGAAPDGACKPAAATGLGQWQHEQLARELEDNWSSANRSLGGSARANPRMVGAVAGIFVNDLGGTLRSRLAHRTGGPAPGKRAALDELLGRAARDSSGSLQFGAKWPWAAGAAVENPPNDQLEQREQLEQTGSDSPSVAGSSGAGAAASARESNLRRGGTLRRAQMALSRMNSLSAASWHAIAATDELSSFNLSQNDSFNPAECTPPPPTVASNNNHNQNHNHNHNRQRPRQQVMYMSSLASQASLSKAAAARAFAMAAGSLDHDSPAPDSLSIIGASSRAAAPAPSAKAAGFAGSLAPPPEPLGEGLRERFRSPDELQLLLLKLIVRGDKTLWKYLAMFTLFGALLTCHLAYFFVHLEQLCRRKGADFSLVTGAMMAAHSVSEVVSFTLVVPRFVPLVGRAGALSACALLYAVRFAYYAFQLEAADSPFTGVPFELAHGIVYGIVYSLITDIACECVDQVDLYFPELLQRGLVDPSVTEPGLLKLQLRATMQGLFSGAFDGLGNGIGALAGGLFLSAYPFAHLWRLCFYVCLVTLLVYPLAEWRAHVGRRRRRRRRREASQLKPSKPPLAKV